MRLAMQRKTLGCGVLLLALAALGGCRGGGYYHDRNVEYTRAELTPPLQLPATRNAFDYRDSMPVPPIKGQYVAPKEHFEVPRPPSMSMPASAIQTP